MGTRWLVAMSVLLVVACGPGGGLSIGGPPSAQSVAQNDSDFSGLKKCPQSGSYDSYLKTEQTKSPDQYTTDKRMWDDLKAAGANDSYIAGYADATSNCADFGASLTGSGKLAYVFAIRFKNETSASASYKTEQAQFHLTDSDLASLKALGGKVEQGSSTGLGSNSTVVSFAAGAVSLYVAFWQNKGFEVALLVYNLPSADGSAVTTKINGRIH